MRVYEKKLGGCIVTHPRLLLHKGVYTRDLDIYTGSKRKNKEEGLVACFVYTYKMPVAYKGVQMPVTPMDLPYEKAVSFIFKTLYFF